MKQAGTKNPEELLCRRAQDLSDRCMRTGQMTCTGFLSPAERYTLQQWVLHRHAAQLVFSGGVSDAERQAGFFLPEWMEELPMEDALRAIKIQSGFARLGHRDYLGAMLGLGIGRPWLGDIWVIEDCAYAVCLPSVEPVLLDQLKQVGRTGVKTQAIALDRLPVPKRKKKELSFTVQSLRLDAVVGGLFRLSRAQASEKIRLGLVQLNYSVCMRIDAPVKQGDILSLRGAGKAAVSISEGTSRKGRTFVQGALWL